MKTTLKVTGMTCNNCVHHVKQALLKTPNVESADVDLASGLATVTGSAPQADLIRAIEEEGYQAVGI